MRCSVRAMISLLPTLIAIAGLPWASSTTAASASRDGTEALLSPHAAVTVEEGTTYSCSNATENVDPWLEIQPSKDLIWHPCYSSPFQCARLLVPLDYSNPKGRQAAIALIRKPALISEHSHLYRGPVLFNPGGPGGSGVDLIRSAGTLFSTILGPQFDIVGFDPRGIGRSTPRASFFDTDVERILTVARSGPLPIVKNGSVSGIETWWAVAQLVGSLAAEHDDGYLGHINTENTATDMLTITQAHGKEKVQYWGFSYGSILGATFASLYPDKIERLIIDGVMDAEDYYATNWFTNLVDTDDSLAFFFNSCAEAGPVGCPFHSSSPENIRHNLTALFSRVRNEPLIVKTDTFYGFVDHSILRNVVFSSLFSPYAALKPLAFALAQLAAGDGTALFSMLRPSIYKCSCNPREREMDTVPDGQITVVCNDGNEVPKSLGKLEEYWKQLAGISEWADVWGSIHTTCVGWPKNKKPFRGPFSGNTSHPILVIGNTADPVTPLRSAKKMAKGFNNSVVLTVDSGGHCSVNAPSVCAQRYVQQYFQDGTLPEPDTVCDPISKNPFLPLSPAAMGQENSADVDTEETKFLRHVMELPGKLGSFLPHHLQMFTSSKP